MAERTDDSGEKKTVDFFGHVMEKRRDGNWIVTGIVEGRRGRGRT